MPETVVALTIDTFLGSIGLAGHERLIRSRAERELLYELTVHVVRRLGEVVEAPAAGNPPAELPMRLGRSAVVVRLTDPTKLEAAATVVSWGFVLLGIGSSDIANITVSTLVSLLPRIRVLRAEYGERSVADAMGQVERRTADEIFIVLNGQPCRYPRARCRFLGPDGTSCAIKPRDVGETLRYMEQREIIRQRNGVEPFEYGIVL